MFNQPPEEQPQESQDTSPFFSMDQLVFTTEAKEEEPAAKKLLGLTPVQRFVIMLLIFVLTCVLGSLCLLLTGKIVLPF